jgi:hypothetical protein
MFINEKLTNAKRDSRMVQVVEHLPSEHKALSSFSVMKKKKNKKYLQICTKIDMEGFS